MKPGYIIAGVLIVFTVMTVLRTPAPTVDYSASGIRPPPAAIPAEFDYGMKIFQEKCNECHGKWAEGTDKGPPLIHKYYEPSHHADFAFYRAVEIGVRAHHWQFGNMAPVAGVSKEEVSKIILFVRWWQRQNDIF